MYIIAGLGNPTKQYENTRHNAGFCVIDYLSEKYNIPVKQAGYKALYGSGYIEGQKVILLKPQTFMNLSGESIREFKSWYKAEDSQIIIIYDDVSLPVGKMRIRPKGSAGGHNGLKSIIYMLNSDSFPRIRIGVGAPNHQDYDLADYVLGRFGKDEIPILEEAIIKAYKAAMEIIARGAQSAMNKYNGK